MKYLTVMEDSESNVVKFESNNDLINALKDATLTVASSGEGIKVISCGGDEIITEKVTKSFGSNRLRKGELLILSF